MIKRFQKTAAFLTAFLFIFSQITFPQPAVPINLEQTSQPTTEVSKTGSSQSQEASLPQTTIDFLVRNDSPLSKPRDTDRVVQALEVEDDEDNHEHFIQKSFSVVAFEDAPDPFSPNLDTSDLSITFQVKRFRELRNTEHFITVFEVIKDSEGNFVKLITSKTPITQPSPDGSNFFQVTTVNSWDGTDWQGNRVRDGTYSYTAVGLHLVEFRILRFKIPRIQDISKPVRGTILLDQTAPTITATQTPLSNANGWNNSDVTISFDVQDALSGIQSVTPNVVVSQEGESQIITGTAVDLAENETSIDVTINLDKTSPVISNLLPANDDTVNKSRPAITADLNDALSGIDQSKIHLLLDGNEVTNHAVITQSSISFTPLADLADGSHTVNLQVEDLAGNLTMTQTTFTVETIVPPIVTPLSGFIHGTVLDAISKEPILGATVTVAGVTGAVQTEGNGTFSIATPEGGSFIATIEKDGFTCVQRMTEVESTFDIAVDTVFLMPLDSAVTRIDSNGGTHVSSTGDVIVEFPQGAVTEPIDVRSTKFQAGNHLPGPLPEQSHFTYAVNFQPVGVQFQVPVTYRIRNDLGFAPGTPIPVGIYNETTASWDILGMSQVTADGQWVKGELSHFTSIDVNLPVFIGDASVSPNILIADLIYTQMKDKSFSAKCPGCEIDMFDGALRQEIVIPPVSLFGDDQAVVLRYDSSQAYPTVLIGSASQVPSLLQLTPTTISATFEFQGQRTEVTFSGALEEVMLRQLFAAQNARGEFLETGLYDYHYTPSNDYSLKYATADFFGGPPREELSVVSPELVSFVAPVTGKVPVVNERESAFGAGWTMEGLERIYEHPDGFLLLTDGTGSALTFTEVFRPAGRTRDFELDPEATFPAGTFVGDSTRFAIDPSGNLYVAEDGITKITPDGTTTQFHPAFTSPRAITIDSDGNVYIAEQFKVWKYVPDGSSRELVYEHASIQGSITDLALDLDGNLYIAATHRLFKRTTGGQATELFDLIGNITGVAIDDLGNVFATETTFGGNNPADTIPQSRIVMQKPDGFLSTYAVGFQDPQGIVIDPDGNLIVADKGLNQILKVTPERTVQAIVKGGGVVSGTPGADEFVDLAYDSSGELFLLHRLHNVNNVPARLISKVVPTSKYFPPPGDFSELSKNPDGSFTRRMKDGVVKNFNADGFLTDTLDRNGNRLIYRYDALGKLTEIEDPVGRKTLFDYTPDGKLASITDPAGSTTYFEIDSAGNLLNVQFSDLTTRSFSYDSEYRMTEEVDPLGFVTEFKYDSLGLLAEEILPEMLVYDPVTGESSLERSHRFFQAEYSSGLVNNIPEGSGTPENPAAPIQRSDVSGSYTDASGQVTMFQSNRLGAPTLVQDSLGQGMTIIRNLDGLPTEIRQSNGLVTTYQYDGFGNATRVRDLSSDSFDGTDTFYFYEPVFNQVTGIRSSLNRETSFQHDANGNLIKISDPDGGFGPNETKYTYDSRGLVTEVKDIFGNKTTFSYDALGNLITVTDALLNITQMTYDARGNVATSTDPLGRVTFFEYDSMNRLIQVTDSDLNITRYRYDAQGNLAEVEDPQGRKTQYSYDALKRLIKIIFPDLSENVFGYDERGNLVRSVDRKGQLIVYFYDELNRLIEKQAPDNATFYEYDSVGNLIRVEDNDSLLRFEYDPLSRLIKAQTGDENNSALTQPVTTLTYEYDKDSHRTKMTSPLGETLYDYVETLGVFGAHKNRGNLVALTNPFGEVFSFTYDDASRRTSLTRPNQTQTTYQYSDRNELTSISHVNTQTASSIQSFQYTYDDTGNRLTKTDSTGLHEYQYDDLNQLTSVSGSDSESYQYDELGNRTSSHSSTSYQYDPLMNRLLEDDTFTYTYDANGNLITKTDKSTNGTTTYTYDSENQLIQIDFPDSSFVEYRYDGLGRRISRSFTRDASLFTLHYLYDGEDILMEYNGTNQPQAYYTHGPGIDEPLSVARDLNQNSTFDSNEHFFYHTDALGSITAVTDSTGNIIESYQYDSFGNPTILDSTHTVIPESLINNPYLFTSREFDSESGLYYFRRRYYDPRIGRFLSRDPLGGFVDTPSSFNGYLYVSNNPLIFTDPFGFGDIAERIAQELTRQYGNVLTREQIYEMATAVERARVIGIKEKYLFLTGDARTKEETFRRVLEKLREKAAHDPEGQRLLNEFADAIEQVDPELAKLCRF